MRPNRGNVPGSAAVEGTRISDHRGTRRRAPFVRSDCDLPLLALALTAAPMARNLTADGIPSGNHPEARRGAHGERSMDCCASFLRVHHLAISEATHILRLHPTLYLKYVQADAVPRHRLDHTVRGRH